MSSATGSAFVSFIFSWQGALVVLGAGVMMGAILAYRRSNDEYDAEEAEDIGRHRMAAVRRFGSVDGRVLLSQGRKMAHIVRFDRVDGLDGAAIKKWMGLDSDEVGDLSGSVRIVGCRPKTIDKLVSKIPFLRRIVLEVYVLSEDSVSRMGPGSVVLNPSAVLEKVAGIYVDLSPESFADVLHIHGLSMFEANQEQNEEYIKNANWRNPAISEQLQKIVRGFAEKGEYWSDQQNEDIG